MDQIDPVGPDEQRAADGHRQGQGQDHPPLHHVDEADREQTVLRLLGRETGDQREREARTEGRNGRENMDRKEQRCKLGHAAHLGHLGRSRKKLRRENNGGVRMGSRRRSPRTPSGGARNARPGTPRAGRTEDGTVGRARRVTIESA